MNKSSNILDKTDKRIEICNLIKERYPSVYLECDTIPEAFHGESVTAIVLGADPGNTAYDERFKYVFGLEKPRSRYFISIRRNLKKLGLSLDNIYVQNVIQNYFNVETSRNKYWYDCALLWLDYLKDELDERFDREVPVYVTSWEILTALIGKDTIKTYSPNTIYKSSKFFSQKENYLGRDLVCLFRNPEYSLEKSEWKEYTLQILWKFRASSNYYFDKDHFK